MDVRFPEMRLSGMETSLQKRLKLRMDMLGLNAFQTAKKAGLGDSFVRDILRGKTRSPNSENLVKLATALETTVDWFMAAGDQAPAPQPSIVPVTGLAVLGKIQAGNWVDRSIIDDSGEYEIIPVALDPRFTGFRQYALEVVGDSMDLKYPEGSFVTCVDYADSGSSLQPGRIIHVERYNGSLVEVTLKAIEYVDGVLMLVPRSSNPRHQPIKFEGDAGTEIVVRGVVIGSYRREIW
jgi:SOS-response transcriptional repressor LexA